MDVVTETLRAPGAGIPPPLNWRQTMNRLLQGRDPGNEISDSPAPASTDSIQQLYAPDGKLSDILF
jgi:hypothetical protein